MHKGVASMARFLGALVLCLVAAVFTVENDQAVRLVFLGLTAPAVHLAFLILAALVLGAAVTVLLGGLQVLRLNRRIGSLERDLATARSALGLARVESAGRTADPAAAAGQSPPRAEPALGGADAAPDARGPSGEGEAPLADRSGP
jgi:uncharacterized integral membrane protein